MARLSLIALALVGVANGFGKFLSLTEWISNDEVLVLVPEPFDV